jgi:peptidoglycan hydrolase-like protein with peptidoglycan-binding domain
LLAPLAVALPAAAQQQQNANPPAQGAQHTMGQTNSSQKNPQSGMAQQSLGKSEIKQVQRALDQKGFKAGRADGILGTETKDALRSFQKAQGLQVTGQIDNQTLSALGVSAQQNGQQGTVGQGSSGSSGSVNSSGSMNKNNGQQTK